MIFWRFEDAEQGDEKQDEDEKKTDHVFGV